jgi:hypothetical protein
MRSSRTDKGVSHFRHVRLCECVQERTTWHSHVGTVKCMQRVRPHWLGVYLQHAHSVTK